MYLVTVCHGYKEEIILSPTPYCLLSQTMRHVRFMQTNKCVLVNILLYDVVFWGLFVSSICQMICEEGHLRNMDRLTHFTPP